MGVNFTWEMSPGIEITLSGFDPVHCVNRDIQYRLQPDQEGGQKKNPEVLANYNINHLKCFSCEKLCYKLLWNKDPAWNVF